MSTKVTLASVFAYAATQLNADTPDRSSDYADLKKQIKAAGLLESQPVYYTQKFIVNVLLFVSAIVLLLTLATWHVGLLLLVAIFWAFVYVQLGTLGHDAGHNQISRTAWKANLIGYLMGNLTIGMSRAWWVEKHNEHHSHPNQLELDPDIDFPIIIFDAAQLEGKNRFQRALIRYQAYIFFPILTLVSVSMRAYSLLDALTKPSKYRVMELLTLGLYYLTYFGLVFYALPLWQALLFIYVHQAGFGLYMGSIFAPNHKGMPVLPADQPIDYLRLQVLTARNVTGHPITDFMYGGLNYQVEHHLFPTAPRNKLREIHAITKQFCRDRSIPFYETSLIQSYVELIQHMHEVSAPLRQKVNVTLVKSLPDPSQG